MKSSSLQVRSRSNNTAYLAYCQKKAELEKILNALWVEYQKPIEEFKQKFALEIKCLIEKQFSGIEIKINIDSTTFLTGYLQTGKYGKNGYPTEWFSFNFQTQKLTVRRLFYSGGEKQIAKITKFARDVTPAKLVAYVIRYSIRELVDNNLI